VEAKVSSASQEFVHMNCSKIPVIRNAQYSLGSMVVTQRKKMTTFSNSDNKHSKDERKENGERFED
jgi:hypothetical protein